MKLQEWTFGLLRIAVAAMWLFAGIPKLLNNSAFAITILNYRIGGIWLASLGAVLVPFWEVILAALLISGKYRKFAWWFSLGLILFFDGLVVQTYLRGLQIDCGCFGEAAEQLIGPAKLIENGILTFLIFMGTLLANKKEARLTQ